MSACAAEHACTNCQIAEYNSFQCFSNLKLFECNLIINLLNLARECILVVRCRATAAAAAATKWTVNWQKSRGIERTRIYTGCETQLWDSCAPLELHLWFHYQTVYTPWLIDWCAREIQRAPQSMQRATTLKSKKKNFILMLRFEFHILINYFPPIVPALNLNPCSSIFGALLALIYLSGGQPMPIHRASQLASQQAKVQ